jgi:acyl-CoA thioesterase
MLELVAPAKNDHLNDWIYLADPSNDLAGNAGLARGDGSNKDGYMTAGITLAYTIFDLNCYSWIKR